ncbi:hypothetical protein [Gloeocapsopsis dulcis]|uniref:Uncharacterized protein n=1 Tax=Gloeocapsopsis dulcis AAB1 = 1H9 TaxID=1433147 RepID=A0A6N8FNZ4_9CHRO|nr:hypothetical protein [Gloeocapsopsis dulcis]MUL35108.1 hypothetical protein [Gloeocapsopsis dulcis AAB1 = 1H9]WNN88990.1 hypothetical protein P0S91_22485 [Gloeocapsopsis dulcis]
MLAQLFFARYPTGNLLSELVEIYQGKFIVQVAVQIEDTTRITSMAAAETIELAEDQARERALLVLMQPATATPVEPSLLQTFTNTTSENQPEAQLDNSNSLSPPQYKAERVLEPITAISESELDVLSDSSIASDQTHRVWSNVTPLRSRSQEFQDDTETTLPPVSSPIDLSDALLNIDVFLKRLGWSAEHESEYLERTYKKRSRQFLTESEVIEFQNYLELLAKTGDEMKRLKWSMQKGRDYLLQTYNKRKRTSLTHQELLEFLQYLESQPSPQESVTEY